jgi:hypothetical protein
MEELNHEEHEEHEGAEGGVAVDYLFLRGSVVGHRL